MFVEGYCLELGFTCVFVVLNRLALYFQTGMLDGLAG